MNRKQRRAQEKLQRARQHPTVEAAQNRISAAQHEAGRLAAMYRTCNEALALANTIAVVEKPEGWTEEDGDPNFFRTSTIEDFTDRLADVRERLILAHEEFYLALEAIDPAQPNLIQVVPPGVVS